MQHETMSLIPSIDLLKLSNDIKAWAKSLGFVHVGISDLDLGPHSEHLKAWLENGYQADMDFFQRNLEFRLDPGKLVPGTLRVISVAMPYLPEDAQFASNLQAPNKAYVSRYALGKDYHKLMRKRLKSLGEKIKAQCSEAGFRPFVDSAPVLEHAFAEKSGIAWTGKHSLSLNNESGSWFFLGELFINLPLVVDEPIEDGCGTCNACISICPTQAIVAPYQIDAKRCISYLTIEYDGIIPIEFREAMGNRVYGCDDCQLICPVNKETPLSSESAFDDIYRLKSADLSELFAWTEAQFLDNLQGSPIRRIGYIKWQRNLSIAIGNAPFQQRYVDTLNKALCDCQNEVLKNHFQWALMKQIEKQSEAPKDNRQLARLTRSIRKGIPRDA